MRARALSAHLCMTGRESASDCLQLCTRRPQMSSTLAGPWPRRVRVAVRVTVPHRKGVDGDPGRLARRRATLFLWRARPAAPLRNARTDERLCSARRLRELLAAVPPAAPAVLRALIEFTAFTALPALPALPPVTTVTALTAVTRLVTTGRLRRATGLTSGPFQGRRRRGGHLQRLHLPRQLRFRHTPRSLRYRRYPRYRG